MEKEPLLGRKVTVKLKDEAQTEVDMVVGNVAEGMVNLMPLGVIGRREGETLSITSIADIAEGSMMWRTVEENLRNGSDENAEYRVGEIVFNQE